RYLTTFGNQGPKRRTWGPLRGDTEPWFRSGEVSSPALHHDRCLWRQRSGIRTCSSSNGDHGTLARLRIMDTELSAYGPTIGGMFAAELPKRQSGGINRQQAPAEGRVSPRSHGRPRPGHGNRSRPNLPGVTLPAKGPERFGSCGHLANLT